MNIKLIIMTKCFLLVYLLMISCSTLDSVNVVSVTCEESGACVEVAYGQYGSLDVDAGEYVYDSQSGFSGFYEDLLGEEVEVPDIDFNDNIIIAVVMGQKSSGCYSVKINEIESNGLQTTVIVTNYEPGESDMCSMAVTNPYYIVSVPYTDESVLFEYQSGDIDVL